MEHIVKNIVDYLKSPKLGGAFHVKGGWGSGKTYFFKEILPGKIKDDVDRIQVMISLFGLGSVKEIPFRLLNAYIKKKSELTGSVSDEMNRGLDYLDMKYGVDRKLFGINLHDEDELIYNIIPKDKVYLCLDDVERFVTKYNVEEIMGTINNLVENMGYKVIVISNDHYQAKDQVAAAIQSQFKEKVIGRAVTFRPSLRDIFNSIVGEYGDETFTSFMMREDVSLLFLPEKRNKEYHKDFGNIRNMKFAISNFYDVFDHFRDAVVDGKTVRSLKYYLAFIIGVSIEYKKDMLSDDDCHGIDVDTDVFSLNLGDDEDLTDRRLEELFGEIGKTPDEKERIEKKKNYDDIYRRRFYTVYAKDVNQRNVFHEEIYKSITNGSPIDYAKLEDNLQEKVFDNEREDNPGNVVVAQSLDGTIFNDTDEVIKTKLQTLLSSVEDGSLKMCAAYVNAFSFLDVYRTVVGKTNEELLEIFKNGFSKYVSTHEIDRMEGTGLEMVAQSIPDGTKVFYEFLRETLHNRWVEKQNQGIEEMVNLFKTDIPSFCSLFAEYNHGVTFHYISEAVLHHIPVDLVEKRMHNMTPKDVRNLALLLNQRFTPQDIFSFHLQKEKPFLEAMNKGIDTIAGEDTVSKVEAKLVLKTQVEKALRNFEIAK
jgi:hypothetical protein